MQKILFSHLFFSTLFILFIAPDLGAQENVPAAIGTKKGIWIYLGNEIPKGFQYQILRKQGKEDFKLLGTTSYPSDEKTMKTKVEGYNLLFDNLDKLGDKEISVIRNYAAKNTTTDTISLRNFPVMHLALGTAYFDDNVNSGESYQYNVRKINDRGTQVWEKTSNMVNFPVKTDILKPVFKNKQEYASQILLRWYVPIQKHLNSFALSRRVFGKGDFEKINAVKGFNSSKDTIYLIAVDTNVADPGFYEYSLIPLDIYGNEGPVSDPVSAGTIRSSYNPVPDYFRAEGKEKDHQVKIEWSFRDKKYLRGIEIFRSSSFDNGFVRIALLSATDSSFIDVVPVANQNYWYYMVIDGPVAKSLPTAKVSVMFRNTGEKPLPPAETEAQTVKGGVKVFWSYREPYAKGFYVYRYVYDKAEYVQVSGLIPAGGEIYSFVDSAGVMKGNDINRYAVRAVNDVDQISDLSPSASASPGVKGVISSPLNPRLNPTDKGIMFIWDDLRNTEPSLLGYKIYRKVNQDKNYSLLPNDTLRNDKNYYRDTTLLPGKSYVYAVSSIDFYGNESPKSVQVTYSIAAEYVMAPEIKSAVSTIDGIMISWGQVADRNITAIKVYRTQPGGRSSVIATLQKDEEQYLDKTTSEGELYTYEISVITGDNKESNRCRGISVRR